MKKNWSLFFKIFITITSFISIYLNFKAFTIKEAMLYYTVQSNVLCFLFYLVTIILYLSGKLKKNNVYYVIKGFVTMAITVTMFIYQIVIANSSNAYQEYELACTFAHLVVPILVISDYLIFGEKGNLKKNYPLIWSISLISYVIFDIIYVMLGGTFQDGSIYPYFYMNIEKYGLLQVMINCFMIYALFVLYGVIVQIIDKKLGNLRTK